MSTVLMEMSSPEPVSEEQLEGMKKAAEACFEINGVDRKTTYLSSDRKRFICVCEAPDAQAVRRALESAGIPYDTVYAAEAF